MKKAIICVGISGGSKSTFSKQFQKENPSYIRINRDDLRAALFNMEGYYNSPYFNEREIIINRAIFSIIVDNLIDFDSFKDDYIFDNTNLNIIHLKKLLEQLTLENIDFKFKLFDIELDEAKKRVCTRENFVNFDSDEVWDFDKVKYIDKQFLNYFKIKEFILNNFKDKILE